MNFNYIIVGAGVLGTSIAYYLKKALPDSNILLIDKNNRAGAGNTAKSAALYRNLFTSPTNRQLAGSSIYYYQQLGEKIKFDAIGYLWLLSEKQWSSSQKSLQQLDPRQDDFEILDTHELRNLLNLNTGSKSPFPEVSVGINAHLCGSLSGIRLAEHYALEFMKLGGKTGFGTEVKSFLLTGKEKCYAPWDNIHFTGIKDQNNITYHADNLIVATGSWTHDLLTPTGIAPSILPKKRQLFGLKLENPEEVFKYPYVSAAPAIILPAGGVYIKPVLSQKMIIVGCADDLGQTYQLADPKPDTEYFHQAIKPVLMHYFPKIKNCNPSLKWAGYYAYHWPDMNPVIESHANLTWASGTSGSGIMKADAIGRITAAKCQGKKFATLADKTQFKVSKLSLRERHVEKEELVI